MLGGILLKRQLIALRADLADLYIIAMRVRMAEKSRPASFRISS